MLLRMDWVDPSIFCGRGVYVRRNERERQTERERKVDERDVEKVKKARRERAGFDITAGGASHWVTRLVAFRMKSCATFLCFLKQDSFIFNLLGNRSFAFFLRT